MFSINDDNHNSDAQGFTEEEAPLKPFQFMIDDAIKKIEAGQPAEQVLDAMLNQLPPSLRAMARKVVQRKANPPQNAMAQNAPAQQQPGKRGISALIANLIPAPVLQKITQLLRLNPKLDSAIRDAGQTLARNGVTPDMIRMTEAQLGDLSPAAGLGAAKDRGERGR